MDANERDQRLGARIPTCLFHPNACQRMTENPFDLRKRRRTYTIRARPKADACIVRSTCFWKSNVVFMLFCLFCLWGSVSILPAFRFVLSSSQIKLVGGYFMHKQQQGFSPPVSNEGELMFQFQKHTPPPLPAVAPHVPTERDKRYAHHVLFVVPVTPQMSQGKTASIPAWLFPADFSNSRTSSRGNSYREPGESAASLLSW